VTRVGVLFLAVVALLIGDVVGLVVVGDDNSGTPERWDPRVADIARFVESERGMRFRRPVPVEFLEGDDYAKAALSEDDTAPGEEASDDDLEGVLRAIGLIARDSDLEAAGEALVEEATLAFYDFEKRRVVVRGGDLTPALRVTVVHELTHVLQDQHFDVDRDFDTDGEETAFRAILEGDADRIEAAYVEQLPDADRRAYEDAAEETESGADLSAVPDAIVQLFAAPYALGDPLVNLLVAVGGTARLDDAIRKPPPSEEVLFDPFTFLDGEKVKRVKEPELADGDESFDRGDFGSVTWFVMLASHVDDRTALRAVDGWGGDSYVAYKAGGNPCIRARFVGDTSLDGDEMFAALEEWRRAFPAGAISVEHAGPTVNLRSCDTGGAVPAPSAALESALVVPAARTLFAAEAIKQKASQVLARCLAAKVLAAFTTEQLVSDEFPSGAPDPARVGVESGRACLREQQTRG
jgi:hypothetical protein